MDWLALDETDAALAREIRRRLPARVLDAHAHPCLKRQLDTENVPILADLPDDCGVETWLRATSAALGAGRAAGGLFFAMPVIPAHGRLARIAELNRYLLSELEKSSLPCKKGLLLVAADSPPDEATALLAHPLAAGFKPYIALNPGLESEAEIASYLPEWALEAAHRRGLAVTLHLAKRRALADPGNLAGIARIAKAYPGLRLILAHAGAGFNMYNTIEGAKGLVRAENIFFDLSAISEPPAVTALLKAFGHTRLMWGSDYPVSLRKGRFITLGNTLYTVQRTTAATALPQGAAQLGLETLRAVLYALDDAGLGDAAVEDVFYGNAARLLGFV